jgi:membrane-associated phospholipid phosphatase
MAGGKHFPTDVIGGALLGSGIGWLVAAVHPRSP